MAKHRKCGSNWVFSRSAESAIAEVTENLSATPATLSRRKLAVFGAFSDA
jgi:hypothetical protein